MQTITIEKYLTEEKLVVALRQILGPSQVDAQFSVQGSRKRWDAAFSIGDVPYVVDYDGDEHYRNALKVKSDAEKDLEASAQGYSVVRIPYWVQLDTVTAGYYFGLNIEIVQDFPHGFISTRIFPASFCELGVARFLRELNQLPEGVRADVLESLAARAEEHGVEDVLPAELRG